MKKALNKKGNISIYVVVAGIMIGAIVFMGIAFSGNIKSSLNRSFVNQNIGFDYYKENIATEEID